MKLFHTINLHTCLNHNAVARFCVFLVVIAILDFNAITIVAFHNTCTSNTYKFTWGTLSDGGGRYRGASTLSKPRRNQINMLQYEYQIFSSRCKKNWESYKTQINQSFREDSSRSSNIDDNDDDDDEYLVTDEEALLACRAYLQRKNRLGWTQHNRRKDLAINSLALAPLSSSSMSSSTTETSITNSGMEESSPNMRNAYSGYFWEDPSELIYLKKGRPRRLVQINKLGGGENEEDKSIIFDETIDGYDQTSMGGYYDDVDDDDDYDNKEDAAEYQPFLSNDVNNEIEGIFNSFPTYPPSSFVKLSQSKKKLFQDPEWKAKWYSKRWGDKQDNTQKRRSIKREKRVEKLIHNIPS